MICDGVTCDDVSGWSDVDAEVRTESEIWVDLEGLREIVSSVTVGVIGGS